MQIHELNTFAGTPGNDNYLAIDNGSDTGKISGTNLLKPVNDRIDNLATSVTPDSAEVLLNTPSGASPGPATLSKSVANFDYLEFYFAQIDGANINNAGYLRVPVSYNNVDVSIPVKDGSGLWVQELKLAWSGTSLTISNIKLWEWDGAANSAATSQSNVWVTDVVKVIGIKTSSNTPAELADIRTGAAALGSISYASAGDAVRGQATALYNLALDVEANLKDKSNLYDSLLIVSESINRFPPQQAGSLTDGAYLKNGSPIAYAPASYTDYIEIEPDTQFSIALVPAYGGATLPSYGLPVILEYYDKNKVFIADEANSTFTTPINARFIRINVATGSGVTLTRLNERCMIVKGNTMPGTFSAWAPTVYANAANMEAKIDYLEDFVTGYGTDYTALSPISTKSNVRIYLNSNNHIVAEASDNTQTAAVFAITKGNKYKLYGFGYDNGDSFFVACASKYNIVAEGVPSKLDNDAVQIPCGRTDYPAGYTYHTLTYVATFDGFLYVNSKTAQDSPAAWVANKVIKTAPDVEEAVAHTYHKHGLYKSGNNYFHFNADGGTNIVRKFIRRGPNNIFQWNQILFGTVSDDVLSITSEYGGFGTDIVGPISIFDNNLWPGQWGQWTGGNHGKTINGVEYPTAEQISFECLVNGEVVTADGIYYGDVRFNTVNKLYFPQSITGADLTQATPAILEHRDYYLDDQMHVRVWLEVINDFSCSLYYGMQCVDTSFKTLFCPNNEYYITLSSLVDGDELHKPERKMLFANDDKLHMDLSLEDIGLGSYSHNDGSNAYVYLPRWTNTKKAYFSLIDKANSDRILSGSNLLWEGTYSLYFSN